MSKRFLVLTFAAASLLIFSLSISQAQAKITIHPICQQGYHQDSVGRGIEGGFTGQNLLPQPGDQICYDFGVSDSGRLQKDDQICQQKFAEGKAQGLIEGGNSDTAECFSYGYMAGVADLHVAVRSGDESEGPRGAECLAAYQAGWQDSMNHARQNSGNDHLRSDCYLTGYYDQEQFN